MAVQALLKAHWAVRRALKATGISAPGVARIVPLAGDGAAPEGWRRRSVGDGDFYDEAHTRQRRVSSSQCPSPECAADGDDVAVAEKAPAAWEDTKLGHMQPASDVTAFSASPPGEEPARHGASNPQGPAGVRLAI